MKDKILLFIIGVLVGAIIATGAFYVYIKTSSSTNDSSQMGMPGSNPPSMPSGQNGGPPAKPRENNSTNNN